MLERGKRVATLAAAAAVLGPAAVAFGAPAIQASTDPAVIAQGKYLVEGPAHCFGCHSSMDGKPNQKAIDAPLTGGFAMELGPLGKITSTNLTPDETGIGLHSDADIERALRYGVTRDGRKMVPLMPFRHMSREDMTAIVSYLRSLPPVKMSQPAPELTPLGWVLFTFMLKPLEPEHEPPEVSPKGLSVERGGYLANDVANCAGCHTKIDMGTMKYEGPPYAGGSVMEAFGKPGWEVVTPNLTPDPETGRIADWDEDKFVRRFKSGNFISETHMPWGVYGKMTDDDLRSIYRYLKTLPPARNDTGPVLRKAK